MSGGDIVLIRSTMLLFFQPGESDISSLDTLTSQVSRVAAMLEQADNDPNNQVASQMAQLSLKVIKLNRQMKKKDVSILFDFRFKFYFMIGKTNHISYLKKNNQLLLGGHLMDVPIYVHMTQISDSFFHPTFPLSKLEIFYTPENRWCLKSKMNSGHQSTPRPLGH